MPPRMTGNPVLVTNQGVQDHLERLSFGDREINEGWLQHLMFTSPDVLPVYEIDPSFGPLIPIGREINTPVGPVDNLFISPTGLPTLVEAKLWRNPQARREVVGQIIDYAKELSQWDYCDLDDAARSATGASLWSLVSAKSDPVLDEARFVDAVARNLKSGKFLLLIVGDGIREEMERMADFLQSSPQLRFTLALIELQVFRIPTSEDLFVVPLVVGRTNEVLRATVQIDNDSAGEIRVSLDESDNTPSKSYARRVLTRDVFFRELKQLGASEKAIAVTDRIHSQFTKDERFVIDWKSGGFSLKLTDPFDQQTLFTVLVVQRNGTCYIGWLCSQLLRVGLSDDLAKNFALDSSRLFGIQVGKHPDTWERPLSMDKIAEHVEQFERLILEFADRLYDQRQQQEE